MTGRLSAPRVLEMFMLIGVMAFGPSYFAQAMDDSGSEQPSEVAPAHVRATKERLCASPDRDRVRALMRGVKWHGADPRPAAKNRDCT
jgi:hypothetical protein